MYTRTEMLDVVMVDGKAQGIVTRNLITGKIESHSAHAVVLATGGYSNVFYLSTNAMASNATAAWRAHKKGALFANPCYTQIHPTCIPTHGIHQSKLTLMSESLRNDGRVWVPRIKGDKRKPNEIPENERFYYLEEKYPTFGNLVPRDVASRNAKYVCDEGLGVGETGRAVYLDFRDAIKRDGQKKIAEKYGNLFDMYYRITDDNPYELPMRIYPAPHYTMGGLWVDYNLMTNLPGLYAIGEANFSDHGANRLGASALMQGLADGYFVLPYTIGDYLTGVSYDIPSTDHPEFKKVENECKVRLKKLIESKGARTPDEIHIELGKIMMDKCGMSRTAEGLKEARKEIQALKNDFENNLKVIGNAEELNVTLEKANRLADFLELGELMVVDALDREESCGGHFREEHQTEEGEARRDDENYRYVAAWEYNHNGADPILHKEELIFENVKLTQRSYK